MKRLLIPILAVASLGAALPAAANASPWQPVNQRQANLDQRIDVGVANGSLTRPEAMRLRGDFRSLNRLEARYRASNGLSAWERRDLDRRFDALSAQIRAERHDHQHRR